MVKFTQLVGSLLSLREGLGGSLAISMNGKLQEAQRRAIVPGNRAGRTNREIADFNNISYNTVKNFSREYNNFIEEGGQDEDFYIKRKKHRRRSDAYNMDLAERVQELINKTLGGQWES